MIFLLHGTDLAKSRKDLLELQQKLTISSKTERAVSNVSPAELRDLVSTFDFFEGAPLVVLDISDAGRANLDEYVDVALNMPKETTLVILSNKKLTSTNAFVKNLAKLNAKVVENAASEESNVFKFVDAVFNGNRKQSYKELQALMLEDKDPFYIFSMLLYGLRSVTAAKFNTSAYEKASPYVKQKALAQAASFSEQNIKVLYNAFYALDKDVKTGNILPELLIPIAIEKVLIYKNK